VCLASTALVQRVGAEVPALGARRASNPRPLVAVGVAVVGITTLVLLARPPATVSNAAVRAAALLGYQFVFLAVMASAYMRRLLHWFGRPFLKVHHLASLLGLGLLAVHPATAAVEWGTAELLLPRFASFRAFLQYGGAPALYLLVLAAIAAAARKRLGPAWRMLHALNYLAFVLATIHACLLGSDFASAAVRIVASAMVAAVVYVGLRRHLRLPSRPARPRVAR